MRVLPPQPTPSTSRISRTQPLWRTHAAATEGAGRLMPYQTATSTSEQSLGSNAVLSSHPDAVRRRQQAQARTATANLDAQNAQMAEWWNASAPSNLISASSVDDLQAAIAQHKLVVVDFFAPWCMACRRLFPALQRLAENNPDILFVKVNGGDTVLSKFVESLAVDKLPYFHFYRGGSLISHFAANLTKISVLRAEIASQKECIMSAIYNQTFFPEQNPQGKLLSEE